MKPSARVGYWGLAGVFAILLVLAGGRYVATVSAVESQEAESQSASRDYCAHPRGGEHVGDCAGHCATRQSCGQCCNVAYPNANEQENYDECIDRCDDVEYDELTT